jgi:hypothetical protein
VAEAEEGTRTEEGTRWRRGEADEETAAGCHLRLDRAAARPEAPGRRRGRRGGGGPRGWQPPAARTGHVWPRPRRMLRGSFLPKTMPSSISRTTSRSVVSRPTCPAAASSRISRAVCSSSSPPPTRRPSVRAALRRASCQLPVCAAARSAASLPRPEILDGPKLRLPGRGYFLFTGPLGAALQLGDPGGTCPKTTPGASPRRSTSTPRSSAPAVPAQVRPGTGCAFGGSGGGATPGHVRARRPGRLGSGRGTGGRVNP